ncbi:cupin domain-containing protein [Aliiglaciecola sp. CAU 1673]|uniref:cupin domain-containing protein n=1 Tax=Aliiglaciecola sp. CAU 1673 TaxID=3032595 RepID=UPI0023DC70A0|nr:cupin domain-containing protein [Aliiglaciecola sp. CAU 1673]MDF2178263.1 cupin domain-containing protein [Aliiglaciecola sp. CAU 1673]
MKPIVNINADDLPIREINQDNKFVATVNRLGPLIGAQKLGCSVVTVPAGKRAWPFHAHQNNEEMFIVLEGNGLLRFGDEQHAISAGDVIACPPDLGKAHQIINDSNNPLKYLAISTMLEPDVGYYPDSDKYLAYTLGDKEGNNRFWLMNRVQENLNYYEGEE